MSEPAGRAADAPQRAADTAASGAAEAAHLESAPAAAESRSGATEAADAGEAVGLEPARTAAEVQREAAETVEAGTAAVIFRESALSAADASRGAAEAAAAGAWTAADTAPAAPSSGGMWGAGEAAGAEEVELTAPGGLLELHNVAEREVRTLITAQAATGATLEAAGLPGLGLERQAAHTVGIAIFGVAAFAAGEPTALGVHAAAATDGKDSQAEEVGFMHHAAMDAVGDALWGPGEAVEAVADEAAILAEGELLAAAQMGRIGLPSGHGMVGAGPKREQKPWGVDWLEGKVQVALPGLSEGLKGAERRDLIGTGLYGEGKAEEALQDADGGHEEVAQHSLICAGFSGSIQAVSGFLSGESEGGARQVLIGADCPGNKSRVASEVLGTPDPQACSWAAQAGASQSEALPEPANLSRYGRISTAAMAADSPQGFSADGQDGAASQKHASGAPGVNPGSILAEPSPEQAPAPQEPELRGPRYQVTPSPLPLPPSHAVQALPRPRPPPPPPSPPRAGVRRSSMLAQPSSRGDAGNVLCRPRSATVVSGHPTAPLGGRNPSPGKSLNTSTLRERSPLGAAAAPPSQHLASALGLGSVPDDLMLSADGPGGEAAGDPGSPEPGLTAARAPDLALHPAPRFRPLHWAKAPCIAGSVWARLPHGGGELPPAAAQALSALFSVRLAGEGAPLSCLTYRISRVLHCELGVGAPAA